MSRITVHFVCAGLVALSLGCGGGPVPPLAPVKGKVTVGQAEPFKKGLVRFIPKPGTNLNSREAVTDEDGNYRIEFSGSHSGLEPGDYLVSFSLYQMPNGDPVPDQSGESYPKSPKDLGAVEFVPKEYTGLSDKNATTVPPEGGTFDFDIPELAPQGKAKGKS